MRGQAGFFDIDERLKDLSAKGDDLERLRGLVDFGMVRAAPREAVSRSDCGKGGRPPSDHVLMFKVLLMLKVLVLQSKKHPAKVTLRVLAMRGWVCPSGTNGEGLGGDQFHGSSSLIRLAGWSGRRLRTSASHARGSTSLSLQALITV